MDYNVTVAIIAKAIIAILLAVGGIIAIWKGASLFRDGVGLNREKTSVDIFKKVKITTSSVGAVLMFTSGAWGWLATQEFHEYSNENGPVVRVSDGTAPPGDLSIPFTATKAELDNPSEVALKKEADRLKAFPDWRIAVGGVATKADGPDSEQKHLAARRADTIKKYLVGAGVAPCRISTFQALAEQEELGGGPSAELYLRRGGCDTK